MQSIHWISRDQAASKISEWKICAYTGMSEKVGPFIYQSRKNRSVIYFLLKKGGQSYTWQCRKRDPFGIYIYIIRHPYYAIYRKLPPPAPSPKPPTLRYLRRLGNGACFISSVSALSYTFPSLSSVSVSSIPFLPVSGRWCKITRKG